jgi:excinuclease ABC subunit A
VHVQYTTRTGRKRSYYTHFEGAIPYIERQLGEGETETGRERSAGFMREVPCPSCHGARLKPLPLAVRVAGRSIAELCALPIGELAKLLPALELSERDSQISVPILAEVATRLEFLLDVGLDYLTLDRASATLAGGEAQRIRLATQIGSGLVGVLYVLDEPSVGLHQRDNHRLLETLTRLRDLGNTLIVVEHDEDTIRAGRCRPPSRPHRRLRPAEGTAGQPGLADRRLPDRAAVRSGTRRAQAADARPGSGGEGRGGA